MSSIDTSRFILENTPDGFDFTLTELTTTLGADRAVIVELVAYCVIDPIGSVPDDWRFAASALTRCRTALRLIDDLGVNPAGAALAVELLERIDSLERGASHHDERRIST